MALHLFAPSSASQNITVTMRSLTTGSLLTGLAAGSVTVKTQIDGSASATTQTLVSGTLGAFTSNGWIETNIAGVYQYGLPNSLLSTSQNFRVVATATGAIDQVESVVVSFLPSNVSQINGQTATAASAITFPSTIASTTNITQATGVALSATGLDSIPITSPTGPASTFREMTVQLWRRFFKKSTLDATSLVTYADDGSTVVTTQTLSDDGTTQTQENAA